MRVVMLAPTAAIAAKGAFGNREKRRRVAKLVERGVAGVTANDEAFFLQFSTSRRATATAARAHVAKLAAIVVIVDDDVRRRFRLDEPPLLLLRGEQLCDPRPFCGRRLLVVAALRRASARLLGKAERNWNARASSL